MEDQVRYYIYVSDSKVNMLFPQIPRSLLSGIDRELKLNLGFFSTATKQQAQVETRYSKLKAVVDYIDQSANVGTIEHPGEYVRGVHLVRWGPYGAGNQVVYFTGSSGKTHFGLGGSMHHLIGANGQSNVTSHSQTPFLLSVLCQALGLTDSEAPEPVDLHGLETRRLAAQAIQKAATRTQGPQQRIEFLAKTLITDSIDPGDLTALELQRRLVSRGSDLFTTQRLSKLFEEKVLLATPIYVAMAE